jgi:hypothetical protein
MVRARVPARAMYKSSQLVNRCWFFRIISVDKPQLVKRNHGSWANLKGGGQLTTKAGNGEQMRGMVLELGSVSGCPRPTPRQRRLGAYGHKCMQVS